MNAANLETLRTVLLNKRGSTEDQPFGPDSLVFKVMGKMYALIAWEETPLRITLKCDPDDALFLRDQYEAVQPGYYMNKRHWNTISLDGSIPDQSLEPGLHQAASECLDHYRANVRKLAKKYAASEK